MCKQVGVVRAINLLSASLSCFRIFLLSQEGATPVLTDLNFSASYLRRPEIDHGPESPVVYNITKRVVLPLQGPS